MEREIQFVTTIDGIKAEGDFEEADQFADYLRFTNNPQSIEGLVEDKTRSIRIRFGELDFGALKESRALVFLQLGFADGVSVNAKFITALTDKFHREAVLFTQFL
jgi:hypothetical protein